LNFTIHILFISIWFNITLKWHSPKMSWIELAPKWVTTWNKGYCFEVIGSCRINVLVSIACRYWWKINPSALSKYWNFPDITYFNFVQSFLLHVECWFSSCLHDKQKENRNKLTHIHFQGNMALFRPIHNCLGVPQWRKEHLFWSNEWHVNIEGTSYMVIASSSCKIIEEI
jgi:hypothetical protein